MSESASAALIEPKLLQSFCRAARFEAGEVLRAKGQHYRDMYVLTDGRLELNWETRGAATKLVSAAGYPIGEIGFLRGCAATATVVARTAVGALIIDDPTFARIEREQPALATQLLRRLAEIAEDRTSEDLASSSAPFTRAKGKTVEIFLCRSEEMLHSAQRLRYEVYCQELGRSSPNADHEKKIITDDLDRFGHTFVAVEAGETIGTLRVNLPSEGSLGHLEDLYGMTLSPSHPRATSVCTKFIVRKAKRGGPAAIRLISSVVRLGRRDDIRECYIDCIPALMPYYKALGFRIIGPKFFHRENGPSYPMVVDLVKYGERLSSDYGARRYLQLYVKAKMIRLIDGLRGERSLAARPEGSAPS